MSDFIKIKNQRRYKLPKITMIIIKLYFDQELQFKLNYGTKNKLYYPAICNPKEKAFGGIT